MIQTRRSTKTGIFFVRLPIFWSTFANSWKQDYFLKSSFRGFSTKINSVNDFNILWKRGGIKTFRSETLSHGTENFCWGRIQCIKNFRFLIFFAWEGDITILCRIFFSHSTKKFRRGTLQCVINFGYRKILCFRELCHDFVSNFFCLTVPKNFVEEPFWTVCQIIPGIEKFYG